MAKKQPLYPHVTETSQKESEIQVVRTAYSMPDGRIRNREVKNLNVIEDTLRSYFNIGAKSIVITYDTLRVEWFIAPLIK